MESFKHVGFPVTIVLLISATVMVPEVVAVRYIVGDRSGWASNVDYDIWTRGYHFYEGDWLFFLYDKNQMDVLEVNRADYETCNYDHPLRNWTSGTGRDVVPLNVTNKLNYYFIASRGFCSSGAKVAIVIDPNPPPPPPSLSLSDAVAVSTFGLAPPPLAVAAILLPFLAIFNLI